MKAKILIIILLLILIGGLIFMGIKHEDTKTHGDKGLASEWNKDHIIDGDVDLDQNSFLNQVIENRTDFPAGPVEGQKIYRTDENVLYIFDGSGWVAVSSTRGESAVVTAPPQDITSTSYVDVTGATKAVTIVKSKKALILFSAKVYSGPDAKINAFKFIINVDGSDVPVTERTMFFTAYTDPEAEDVLTEIETPLSIMHIASLNAGAHTIKVRAKWAGDVGVGLTIEERELDILLFD